MNKPDSPGWWAFEGSEWESEPIYVVNGVTIYGFQEEWVEDQNEHWHKYELHLYEPKSYRDVPGEPFTTIVEVKWIYKGMAACQPKRSGPYEGEPVLGFLSPKYRWDHALYTVDTWVGEWTKVNVPWDQAKPKEIEMPAMEVQELTRRFDGAMRELRETEQILGEALGYPRYCDDPKNFPEATEADGVCVGEMTPALLAKQLADDHKLLTIQNTSFMVQAMVYEVPDEKMPRPDWTGVPEEFTWWTVDGDGEFHFWRAKPYYEIYDVIWYHADIERHANDDEQVIWQPEGSCYIDIPFGIDWRMLIQQRP